MSDHPFRPFDTDAEVRRLGERLISCTLSREEWTHEAHLAACLYLLVARRDIDVDARIAGLIRRFNESVGGVNDDANGYHDGITRAFVAGVRLLMRDDHGGGGLHDRVNRLLDSPMGRRDWPLRFYSRGLLFTREARRGEVGPDIAPFPAA